MCRFRILSVYFFKKEKRKNIYTLYTLYAFDIQGRKKLVAAKQTHGR